MLFGATFPLEQLEKLVVENILAFDEVFWIRLATRSDTCKSDDDKASVSIVLYFYYFNDQADFFSSSLFFLCVCGNVSFAEGL